MTEPFSLEKKNVDEKENEPIMLAGALVLIVGAVFSLIAVIVSFSLGGMGVYNLGSLEPILVNLGYGGGLIAIFGVMVMIIGKVRIR